MSLSLHEKKVYSQNGEDGVIDYIFSKIGFTNKKFCEFGFHYNENNSRHLIEKHNFKGLFIDSEVPKAYRNKCINGIHFHQDWITLKNINELIGKYLQGNIDFLSIDVSGTDLWLLDAINVISPRLVCIEYCSSMGKELSVTVEYADKFIRHDYHKSGFYCNASLKANINVMKKKGYSFVGTVFGLNAFFVRNDCNFNGLKALTCEEGWRPHHTRTYKKCKRFDGTYRALTPSEQFDIIKDLNWIEVDDDGNIKNN